MLLILYLISKICLQVYRLSDTLLVDVMNSQIDNGSGRGTERHMSLK